MYPNQPEYHFNIGLVTWYGKMLIKKWLLQKTTQLFGPDLPIVHSSTEFCSLWAASGCYVMDFYRQYGSWHSVQSPVACLCPHATWSVVLDGKPNRLRNCFMFLLLGYFFSRISFTAWCSAWLPNQPCYGEGEVLQRWGWPGLGRSGTA